MSRSRSPTPTRGYYQCRRSRSTSPIILSKEDQLKKIADFSITGVNRIRCHDNVFGTDKEFWSAVQTRKRNDKNFDIERAKTWWLKFNQTLPSTDMAKNILGNLITSTNTFNKINKSCIDIICREQLEDYILNNWDDTMLRCTIAANIDQFQTSNTPSVSHYYMTNDVHQYTDKPSSRCTTPVIPPDNNPVIVIHSCNVEKVEKERNKQSYRYNPYKSP
jgi:hypothetical protein